MTAALRTVNTVNLTDCWKGDQRPSLKERTHAGWPEVPKFTFHSYLKLFRSQIIWSLGEWPSNQVIRSGKFAFAMGL